MGKSRILSSIGAGILIVGLSGCDEAGQLNLSAQKDSGDTATSAVGRPAATTLVEQDVEAPEVFQSTEAGLWDGRPSLGGVWVAHPDVTDPERVIIRNKTNGKFVIGALFKRERDNPGPRFQVSSDAAAALGLLAGAPSELNVTALRRKEVGTPDAAPQTAPESEALVAEAQTGASVEPGTETPSAAAPEEPKKKRTFKDLFARKKKPAEPQAPATAEVETAQLEQPEAIETQSLSPLAAADAALSRVEGGSKQARREAASRVITPAQDTGATLARAQGQVQAQRAATAATKPSGKPFVQIGYFSVEGNASNTATALRQAGIVPTVRKQESQGKTFWRVIAGPVSSSADRSALLKKVKGLGFEDAYFVTN